MKTLNQFITENNINESYGGSVFNGEDSHYGITVWKRWEKEHKKDYNIIFDEDIQCYLIYTKSKGNNIGKHVGTYNALDGIFYYDSVDIKNIYPSK